MATPMPQIFRLKQISGLNLKIKLKILSLKHEGQFPPCKVLEFSSALSGPPRRTEDAGQTSSTEVTAEGREFPRKGISGFSGRAQSNQGKSANEQDTVLPRELIHRASGGNKDDTNKHQISSSEFRNARMPFCTGREGSRPGDSSLTESRKIGQVCAGRKHRKHGFDTPRVERNMSYHHK